jgi:PilZ domain-containing protein
MQERRKRRRFPVRQPALLIVEGDNAHELRGTTENVSESGALVLAEHPLPEGTAVRLIVILEEVGSAVLRLSCPGKVVRIESSAMGSRIAVAIQCSQTLTDYASPTMTL